PGTQTPAFTLVKALTSINGDAATTAYNAVGEVLTAYDMLHMTGNQTWELPILNDALTGLTKTIVTLAPNGVETFTTTYTVTQSDLDNGSVLKTARAHGGAPVGCPVGLAYPADEEEETPGTQTPAFTLVKALTS